MTPSWSHQMNSIVFRPKRSWGRCWWLGSIQDFLRLGFWKKIHFSSLVNPMQERLSFLSCWQAEFSMCFSAAPSTYRSIHAAPIFRSFEPSPWHVAAWKWLLEKHPIARQAFFAIGSSSKRTCNWQSSIFLGRFSRFLSHRSKLSSLNRRNQSLHVVSIGLHKHLMW